MEQNSDKTTQTQIPRFILEILWSSASNDVASSDVAWGLIRSLESHKTEPKLTFKKKKKPIFLLIKFLS